MATTFPTSINATSDLQVTIYLHEFYLGDRERRCWTYITRGLDHFSQQEMALSLLLEDEDEPGDFPKTPIKIFQLLGDYAKQGRTVTAGEATKLGTTGLFGFPVLFYLPAIQYQDLPPVDNHLALMLIHQDEYEFARRFGLSRLVSRISKLCSCFPYPTWNTRQRPSLFEANHREDSVLNGGHANLNIGRALLHGRQLSLWLHPDHQQLFTNLQQPLTLLCEATSDADAALYWDATSTGAVTIAATPADIGLSFVQFRITDIPSLALVEDGAVISITDEERTRIASATSNEVISPLLTVYIDERPKHGTPSYQVGAGWIEPEQINTLFLERQIGNISLNQISHVSLSANREILVAVATEIQDMLADVMSEETESFQLALTISDAQLSLAGDIEFNPQFVSFITQSLSSIDLAPLDQSTISLAINPE